MGQISRGAPVTVGGGMVAAGLSYLLSRDKTQVCETINTALKASKEIKGDRVIILNIIKTDPATGQPQVTPIIIIDCSPVYSKSMHNLRDIANCMANRHKNAEYMKSNLTRLLQFSFSGPCTLRLMVHCKVSSFDLDLFDSLSSLNFSALVMKIHRHITQPPTEPTATTTSTFYHPSAFPRTPSPPPHTGSSFTPTPTPPSHAMKPPSPNNPSGVVLRNNATSSSPTRPLGGRPSNTSPVHDRASPIHDHDHTNRTTAATNELMQKHVQSLIAQLKEKDEHYRKALDSIDQVSMLLQQERDKTKKLEDQVGQATKRKKELESQLSHLPLPTGEEDGEHQPGARATDDPAAFVEMDEEEENTLLRSPGLGGTATAILSPCRPSTPPTGRPSPIQNSNNGDTNNSSSPGRGGGVISATTATASNSPPTTNTRSSRGASPLPQTQSQGSRDIQSKSPTGSRMSPAPPANRDNTSTRGRRVPSPGRLGESTSSNTTESKETEDAGQPVVALAIPPVNEAVLAESSQQDESAQSVGEKAGGVYVGEVEPATSENLLDDDSDSERENSLSGSSSEELQEIEDVDMQADSSSDTDRSGTPSEAQPACRGSVEADGHLNGSLGSSHRLSGGSPSEARKLTKQVTRLQTRLDKVKTKNKRYRKLTKSLTAQLNHQAYLASHYGVKLEEEERKCQEHIAKTIALSTRLEETKKWVRKLKKAVLAEKEKTLPLYNEGLKESLDAKRREEHRAKEYQSKCDTFLEQEKALTHELQLKCDKIESMEAMVQALGTEYNRKLQSMLQQSAEWDALTSTLPPYTGSEGWAVNLVQQGWERCSAESEGAVAVPETSELLTKLEEGDFMNVFVMQLKTENEVLRSNMQGVMQVVEHCYEENARLSNLTGRLTRSLAEANEQIQSLKNCSQGGEVSMDNDESQFHLREKNYLKTIADLHFTLFRTNNQVQGLDQDDDDVIEEDDEDNSNRDTIKLRDEQERARLEMPPPPGAGSDMAGDSLPTMSTQRDRENLPPSIVYSDNSNLLYSGGPTGAGVPTPPGAGGNSGTPVAVSQSPQFVPPAPPAVGGQ
eukprot:TRINITY_DN63042_c0_g1_i1.p1 TRINITY_DN63042_c0_g1~~TRINITY_DN63042_c0_g1_i1.p1  ORF type:complete len:1238 (-),score=167.07 TRINITY_DN63042_c0_g1_i1:2016-5225(-)